MALTGGIATGKSYCLRRFAELGAPVIDADRLAREAVEPGTPGLAAVSAQFGSGVLAPDGSLDRAALGRLVFADAHARAALEAIIHPDVYRRIREWIANQPSGVRLAIADIPLVFETGHNHDFDRVVVAACERAEQVRRVIARDGLGDEEARARIAAQWPIEEKVKRASYAIWTDRGNAETDAQVRELYAVLLAES
ncbi:MAG TPA: dephospho-CoA kinase [Vicinamibacterales bacterium]|nr:dephospho-CoA kinase [Vicinamibacterales bacterium]